MLSVHVARGALARPGAVWTTRVSVENQVTVEDNFYNAQASRALNKAVVVGEAPPSNIYRLCAVARRRSRGRRRDGELLVTIIVELFGSPLQVAILSFFQLDERAILFDLWWVEDGITNQVESAAS